MPREQHLPRAGLRLPGQRLIGGGRLAEVYGQVQRRRVGGEGAAPGLAAEVLVEAQAHQAELAQRGRQQAKRPRQDAEPGNVPVRLKEPFAVVSGVCAEIDDAVEVLACELGEREWIGAVAAQLAYATRP